MNPIGACEFTQRKVGLGTEEEAIGSNLNSVKVNGTDLRTLLHTHQPLCRGFGGGTASPNGGFGGLSPQSGFFQTRLKFA